MIKVVAPPRPQPESSPKSATCNACRLCAPLGACLAFRGVEGAMPLLHGSQGCATYIRRYMISHFREPLDIASSNFSEEAAVFGGRENLRDGLENVVRQYAPRLIGIATTCLAETIGDDVAMYLREIAAEGPAPLPEVVHVSTPSYSGSHEEGFHATVRGAGRGAGQGGPAARGGQRDRADGLAGRSALPEGGLPRLRPGADPAARLLRHAGRPGLDRVPADSAGRHSAGFDPPHGQRPGHRRIRRGVARGPDRGQVLEERFGVPCHARAAAAGRDSDRPALRSSRRTQRPAHARTLPRAARPAGRRLRRRPQVRLRQAGRRLRRAGPGRGTRRAAGGNRRRARAVRLGDRHGPPAEQLAAVEADLAGDIAGAGRRRFRRDRGAGRRRSGRTW